MRSRRLEFLIFAGAFFAFAFFNQGGGWNQNSRFAEVRAIVEQGRFSIDDYLVYRPLDDGSIIREPIRDGDLTRDGETLRLAWADEHGEPVAINGRSLEEEGVQPLSLTTLSASGDVAFARGHFHPNKPPGSSFVAVPAYALLVAVEKGLGKTLDDPWLMVVNAWLTSALSIGLLSAVGCVIFFRLAWKVTGGRTEVALLVTLTFAFGTLYFPFATLLFDHNLTAVCLLAAFYSLFRPPGSISAGHLLLSGFAAGMAAITNYVSAVAVVFLAVYALAQTRDSRHEPRQVAVYFLLGVLGPLLAICAYNQVCYGSPFALSNSFQNPLFQDAEPKLLGMFGIPRPDYALAVLISPLRGLFYSAPVLALGVFGWWKMRRSRPAEATLFAAIFGLYFLVIISFVGWHAGFSSGPRYLIPAIPFLALPMAFGFLHWPRCAAALATVSIGINSLFTFVDPESPVGVGSLAMVEGRPIWSYSPLTDYALPLFVSDRAWPILDALIDEKVASLDESSQPGREALLEKCRRGDPDPFLLASFTGPVSVNPISVYEGNYYQVAAPNSPAGDWASFNAGELLFPQSHLSLAPLLLVEILLAALAFRILRSSPAVHRVSRGGFRAPQEIPRGSPVS